MERIHLSSSSYLLLSPFSPYSRDFEELKDLLPETRGQIRLFGKHVATPRFFQSYGQSYHFSGQAHEALDFPSIVRKYLNIANENATEGIGVYNMALVNWYRNGHDYIGPHSDDETQLLLNSPIFSISFGETRTFRIREKKTRSIVKDLPMKHGDIIVMCGKMQKEFTHEIVKVSGKRGEQLGMRINVTCRMFQID